MYDFCPYCGKQLENGEKCPTCRPREYNTYSEPTYTERPQSEASSDAGYNYGNANYNRHYNEQYEAERARYDAEFKVQNNKKNVIVMSVICLVMAIESRCTFWGGLFPLITGIISLVLGCTVRKKNKKLNPPLTVAKVAFVLSIIALIVGILSFVGMIILMFGDGILYLVN